MTKKSFLMTLGVGVLVVAMGLTSCTKKKPKPVVSSSTAPTSEVSDNSSSQPDVSESSSAVEVSSSSIVDDSSVNTSSAISDDSSSSIIEDSSSSTIDDSSSSTIDDSSSSDPITTGATIKIGAAEPVAMEDVSANKGDKDTWSSQYKIDVAVKAGDKLEFAIDGTVVTKIGPDEGKNNLSKEMTVINDADATIYFKVYPDGGYSVWVTGLLDQGGIDDPITTGVTIKIGTAEPAAMTATEKGATDPWEVQYKADVTVKAGDKLEFAIDGTVITKIGPDSGKNNLDKNMTVINDATGAVYLKKYADGGYSVWVEGLKPTTGGDTVAISSVSTLYLKPNANWTQNSARFAAYFFNGSKNMWVDMTDVDGDGVYEVAIDDKVKALNPTNVIFCRMDPAKTENNWNNKWNQTADLELTSNTLVQYVITDGSWDAGTWTAAPTAAVEPAK